MIDNSKQIGNKNSDVCIFDLVLLIQDKKNIMKIIHGFFIPFTIESKFVSNKPNINYTSQTSNCKFWDLPIADAYFF